MNDTELYSQIHGLTEPWFVEVVELITADARENIHVEQGTGVCTC